MENNNLIDWRTFQDTEIIPYKITIKLKPEQNVGNGYYKVHINGDTKVVPNNAIIFYTLNFLDAIQTFDRREALGFKIEYNY